MYTANIGNEVKTNLSDAIAHPKKRGRPPKVSTDTELNQAPAFADAPQTKQFSLAFFKKLDNELDIFKSTFKGYSEKDIDNIINNPQNYQNQIVDLSRFFYRSSGFYQRVIDYFSSMAKYNWMVNTEVKNDGFYSVQQQQLSKNYLDFINQVNKIKIEQDLPKILKTVFLEDAVFGYFLETDLETTIYYLPSSWCAVRKKISSVLMYGINTRSVPQADLEKLPKELQKVLRGSADIDGYVYPEPSKSFLIKYNSDLSFLYPPFFSLLKCIVDINDYKLLNKVKTEQDNYNLLSFEIPIDDKEQDSARITGEFLQPFMNSNLANVPKNTGVIVSPVKVTPIDFKTNGTAERDKVRDSISQFYDESGVSQSILASSTSGAELKLSIKSDMTEVFKLYRQIEQLINLKMQLLGINYPSYNFVFSLLDITCYNEDEFAEKQLKFSQASIPNKMKLLSSLGVNPAQLFGNEYMENIVFNLGETWTVLKSSYTQSGETDGGKPSNESQGKGLSKEGEQSVESDANNPDNRI